jgi:hypothetical protein
MPKRRAAIKNFERAVEWAQRHAARPAIVVVLRPPQFVEEVEARAVTENERNRCDPEIVGGWREKPALQTSVKPRITA